MEGEIRWNLYHDSFDTVQFIRRFQFRRITTFLIRDPSNLAFIISLYTSIHFPLSIQPRDTNFLSFFIFLWMNPLYIYISIRSIRNLQLPVRCFHSRETRFPLRLFR